MSRGGWAILVWGGGESGEFFVSSGKIEGSDPQGESQVRIFYQAYDVQVFLRIVNLRPCWKWLVCVNFPPNEKIHIHASMQGCEEVEGFQGGSPPILFLGGHLSKFHRPPKWRSICPPPPLLPVSLHPLSPIDRLTAIRVAPAGNKKLPPRRSIYVGIVGINNWTRNAKKTPCHGDPFPPLLVARIGQSHKIEHNGDARQGVGQGVHSWSNFAKLWTWRSN